MTIVTSKLIEKVVREQGIVKTSTRILEGMNDLYDVCYEVFCSCGDLR